MSDGTLFTLIFDLAAFSRLFASRGPRKNSDPVSSDEVWLKGHQGKEKLCPGQDVWRRTSPLLVSKD